MPTAGSRLLGSMAPTLRLPRLCVLALVFVFPRAKISAMSFFRCSGSFKSKALILDLPEGLGTSLPPSGGRTGAPSGAVPIPPLPDDVDRVP